MSSKIVVSVLIGLYMLALLGMTIFILDRIETCRTVPYRVKPISWALFVVAFVLGRLAHIYL